MELSHTRYEVSDGVALVTLHRPERLNAFTPTMREELKQIFSQADQDDRVRVVVVTGAGRAFCAGADLSGGGGTCDRRDRGGEPVRLGAHRDGGGQVSLAIHTCRKPVIAAINGPAVGVGFTITLAMDMRVAAEDAKLGLVFARRGVVLEACSSWFLPRLVGMAKASEWVYSGRTFTAAQEKDSGLFNYVLPAAEVLPKALELASEIAQHTSAMSVTLSKALLWRGQALPDPQSAHLADSRVFLWAGRQADAREGIQAFLEKRPPRFSLSPTKDLPDFYPWWQEPKV
ncbi:MAG: enoyl-CoA hydratase/isomerase family protein [Desulfarculus sp.]|nr:enoyl-CoA hydratase/isomerase family protein [Desulfarculus sp.]